MLKIRAPPAALFSSCLGLGTSTVPGEKRWSRRGHSWAAGARLTLWSCCKEFLPVGKGPPVVGDLWALYVFNCDLQELAYEVSS